MTSRIPDTPNWRRVVRVDYGGCLVAGPEGSRPARTRETVAVGDWVEVSEHDDLVVEAIAVRRTQVTRRDPAGLLQVLAANVDRVFVTAPADRLSMARVEREVAIGWDSGAEPVVLLTKADLDDGSTATVLRERLLGVDVVPVSAAENEGVDAIRYLLQPDLTAVLIGPSGAGKSTLVNALLGESTASTGAVREGDHRGRHTTTARELHAVPTGGFLIDTPGLRSLSLAVDADAVSATFPDIVELAVDCRFRDCTHGHEPGCAVLAAVSDGTLSADRIDSYMRLMKELDYQLRRDDPLAAQAHAALWRQRRMDARRLYRERGHR